jgi:glycerol-3-phosphate O-acyltransferase 3/4
VKYHGLCPKRKAGQIFVANHTSMIDMIILEQVLYSIFTHTLPSLLRPNHSSPHLPEQFRTFAVVGQKHTGWVGLMQDRYLQSLGSVWFDRTSGNDRQVVAARLKAHVQDANNNNMLIFPEGTCVNNDFAIMFKKGNMF